MLDNQWFFCFEFFNLMPFWAQKYNMLPPEKVIL